MYRTSNYQDLSFINENTGWLIHLYGLIFRTTNGGNNYSRMDSVYIGSFTDVAFANASTGWISSRSNNLYKTTNGGANLVRITNFPDPVPGGLECIHILNDQFIYGCGSENSNPTVIKSTDGGSTWMTKSLQQFASGLTDCYMFNANTGIAVGSSGTGVQEEAVILRTTDGGDTWTLVYEGNRERESAERISFVDNFTGYVSLERITIPERFVLKTTNGGVNWFELSFPSYHEHGIGFISANTGWIGGYFNPTFGTTDGGQTWNNANIGQFISGFQFFGDTLGYACGQYIYKYAKTNNITQTSSEIPDNFELYQNYPNPFNPGTSIKYSIMKGSKVLLTVFDITGREVAELVNQYQAPGSYEYRFDGNRLNSGVYYYKISAGEFASVKKMLLVK
jgi:photosystem II stability/assembly factor-like uncharacterized protein